jgi:GTP-binding protein
MRTTLIIQAEFVSSSTSLSGCPGEDLPEYAFIGRSNVGKSSLINMLVKRKNLARISSTPGKTRLINHFRINGLWFLADLPGYGYAKRSKKERDLFSRMIREYVTGRRNLACLFVLVDARIPPQRIDLEFIGWLGASRIPFVILLTKADKVGQQKRSEHLKLLLETLSETWEVLPRVIETSAVKDTGREEILRLIGETNETLGQRPESTSNRGSLI